MKNAMKKLMSLVLVAVLLVSAVPFAASAAEPEPIYITVYQNVDGEDVVESGDYAPNSERVTMKKICEMLGISESEFEGAWFTNPGEAKEHKKSFGEDVPANGGSLKIRKVAMTTPTEPTDPKPTEPKPTDPKPTDPVVNKVTIVVKKDGVEGTAYDVEIKNASTTVQNLITYKVNAAEIAGMDFAAAYVSNRPMPIEYDGNDDVSPAPSGSSVIEETSANTPLYNNVDEFTSDNTKNGKLRVQAYASQQVFPIQNAKVTVEKEFRNGRELFNESYTDIDGIAQNIVLPAKDKRLSLTASGEIPYTTYRVTVSHPQFETLVFDRVPIFDSIESMQPAAMVPKTDNLTSKVIMDTDAGTVRR